VCDEFWLVGRGVVTSFDGDLDDYQRYLLEESRRLREEARSGGPAAARGEAAGTGVGTGVGTGAGGAKRGKTPRNGKGAEPGRRRSAVSAG